VDAAGVNAASEKAIAVKQAAVDSEKEKPSTLVENVNFNEEKKELETRVAKMQSEGESTDVDVVKGTVTSKTPPTTDTAAFTVAIESKGVSFDGKTTKEVTTPTQQAGNNIALSGLTKRKVRIIELFKEDDFYELSVDEYSLAFTLEQTPIEIHYVYGYSYDENKEGDKSPARQQIYPSGHKFTVDDGFKTAGGRTIRKDYYEINGKEIKVTDHIYSYEAHEGVDSKGKVTEWVKKRKGVVFRVAYSYLDIYDPNLVNLSA